MEDCVGVIINNRKLIVNKEGEIWGINKRSTIVKLIDNIKNKACGYNQIRCGNKMIMRHRILAYVYLNLDIDNPKIIIDHRDRNRLNNNLSNLRIVTFQQNNFNTNAKGYSYYKRSKKWITQIRLNTKLNYLGSFTTEEEAHNAYLEAKKKYHII